MAIHVGARLQTATGGAISTASGYRVHIFSTSGIDTFVPQQNGVIEVLVVGGGGGDGSYGQNGPGGGGGGGAVAYSKFIPVSAGVAYTVMVGAAGTYGGLQMQNDGGSGGISTFFAGGPSNPANKVEAYGGGGGGASAFSNFGRPGVDAPNASGGGGGSGYWSTYPGRGFYGNGANVYGLGYPGGNGTSGNTPSPTGVTQGGCGGGAGGVGADGSTIYPHIRSGGPGVPYTITGTNAYYGTGSSTGGPVSLTPVSYGWGGVYGGAVIIRYPQ